MTTEQRRFQGSAMAAALVLALLGLTVPARGQLVVDYGFTLNQTIPDGSGQFTDMRTLGGFASYSNVAVSLVMSSPNGGNPMFLGDMYSTLTIGNPSEGPRSAVLLNRPGRDNMNAFGSSLSSLNVTLDDSAMHPIIWGTTSGTGTYNSDGRPGVNPYGSGVAFSDGDRTATLAGLNGSSFASNNFTLLMADVSSGGQARLDSWGMTVSGAAAGGSTTLSAGGGTMVIRDTGSGATNNIGMVDTTQAGGGNLVVNIGGTMTFGGATSGTSGLTKQGTGILILSNAAGNSYGGTTTVSGGTLLVNNTSGSGTSTGAVTVSNSGTVLGGTGSISGAVSMGNGAFLRGGDGSAASGALSLSGAVTMASGSVIELALGSLLSHSTLAVTGGGTLAFATMQAFHFLDFGATAGVYNNIITGITDPGTGISNWSITNNGWMGTFLYDGLGNIDLTLTAVPEPGTWAAGILSVLALGYTQRRRLGKLVRRQ